MLQGPGNPRPFLKTDDDETVRRKLAVTAKRGTPTDACVAALRDVALSDGRELLALDELALRGVRLEENEVRVPALAVASPRAWIASTRTACPASCLAATAASCRRLKGFAQSN